VETVKHFSNSEQMRRGDDSFFRAELGMIEDKTMFGAQMLDQSGVMDLRSI